MTFYDAACPPSPCLIRTHSLGTLEHWNKTPQPFDSIKKILFQAFSELGTKRNAPLEQPDGRTHTENWLRSELASDKILTGIKLRTGFARTGLAERD